MPERAEIRIDFGKRSEAEAALAVTEDLIRFHYALQDDPFDDAKPYLRGDPYKLFMARWPYMKSCRDERVQNPRADSALQHLRTENESILFENCSGLQKTVPDLALRSRESFFNCLCFILAWRFPKVSFETVCRYQAEEGGPAQETMAVYDTKILHFEQWAAGSADGAGPDVTSDWMIAPKCIFYEQRDRSQNPDDDEDDESNDEDDEYEEEDDESDGDEENDDGSCGDEKTSEDSENEKE